MIRKLKKFKHKILLALLITISSYAIFASTSSVSAGSGFIDISVGQWPADYVQILSEKGIINGYGDGTFRPKDPLRRGQGAKMIAVAAELDYEGKEAAFSDVPQGHEMSAYISALVEKRAIRGFPEDGTFRMHDSITRRQIAQIVAEAFDLAEGDLEVAFRDIDFVGGEYVRILASNGIVGGYENGTLFKPNDITTRAQFSQILSRAMEVAKNDDKEAIEKPAPKPNKDEILKVEYLGNNRARITGTGDLSYNHFTLKNPDRLVFDFEGVDLAYRGSNIRPTDSSNIKEIRFAQNNGFTRVTFELTGEYTFKNNKENTSIDISVDKPKVFKLAIDTGHGVNTPGKRVPISMGYGDIREWTLNDRITREMIKLLKEYKDVEVLRLDDPTGRVDISLTERANAANVWGADLLISNHHNAGVNGGPGGGLEVYRFPNSTQFTRQMQQNLYNHIIAQTGLRGNRASPLGEANFLILNRSNMASVLIEHGYMDSPSDLKIIMQPDFAVRSARGIVNFLEAHYNIKK